MSENEQQTCGFGQWRGRRLQEKSGGVGLAVDMQAKNQIRKVIFLTKFGTLM